MFDADSTLYRGRIAVMAACLCGVAMPVYAQQAHIRGEVGIEIVSASNIVRVGYHAGSAQVDLANTDYHMMVDHDGGGDAVVMVTY